MKKRTDLKISFECNNHCLFCVQGRKREMFKAKDMGRIREELERGYSSGNRALVITGGEPAINKNIFEIVRLARKTGYENVLIQTNGRMFRYPDFCKEMRDAKVLFNISTSPGSAEKKGVSKCSQRSMEVISWVSSSSKSSFQILPTALTERP